MIRFLATTAIFVLAAGIGLLVAELLVSGMSIDVTSYVTVIVIFAILQAVLSPFIAKMAARNAPALLSGAGLLTTLISLLITNNVSQGMHINGFSSWAYATLIVWIASMVASFVLPFFIARRVLQNARDRRRR